MPLLADRVKETTTTTGTGQLTLAGAPTGFQSFTTAFGNGASVYYVIAGGAQWEIGIGTTGAGTLTRETVLQSTNADALVDFAAGVKDVFCSYVADRAVTTSDTATLTNKTIDSYTNDVGANSTHFRIKAGATLGKGDVIRAVGFTPGEQAIEVVKVASANEPSIGICEQALTSGQFGMAVVIGELFNVNTNGFTVNQTLYSNGTGGFTATKPSSGLYQVLGWVVRANANNGVIAVNVVSPLYVEASTNTANTSVIRDGSGNFAAGTITGALTGNASTATTLQTARTINGVSFNGSADITVAAAAGTLTGTTLASNVTASNLTSVGTLANLTVTNPITGSVTGSSGSTTGNAATATTLQTARTINGVSFNGSANITVPAAAGTLTGSTLASGVTASSLTSVGTIGTGTWQGSAIADTYLATISTAGKVSNSATTATSANTASAIVARDSSGNFSAGTITAALTGNASTATALQTARAINGVNFDGTAAITVAAAAGTLTGTTLAAGVTASSLTSVGTLAGLTVTAPITGSVTGSSGSTTGNAATATALQTARAINGVNFDGTAAITVTAAAGTLTGATLSSGVTASSLTSVGTLSSLGVTNNITSSSGIISAGADFRLSGSSFTRVADADTGGGFGGGYNLMIDGGTAKHDSTGNISGYHYKTGGSIELYTGSSQPAGTTATPKLTLDANGNLTMTGTVSMADNVISRPRFTDYAETYTTPAISSNTLTLNLENGNVFRVTRNANISTLTISNPAASGNACSFTLIFDANGTSYTITWPAAVKWPGGTAPTITTTNGRSDMFVFYTNNAGTTWYAMTAAQNFVTT
jgi:hypothetical protein